MDQVKNEQEALKVRIAALQAQGMLPEGELVLIPNGSHVYGFEAYNSPEFRAFCAKYGIAWELHTKELCLLFTEDDLQVFQRYRPKARNPKFVDTTNAHNKEFRTAVPSTPPDVPVEVDKEVVKASIEEALRAGRMKETTTEANKDFRTFDPVQVVKLTAHHEEVSPGHVRTTVDAKLDTPVYEITETSFSNLCLNLGELLKDERTHHMLVRAWGGDRVVNLMKELHLARRAIETEKRS